MMRDFEFTKNPKEAKPKLVAVIEKHLLGDFESWEDDRTRWDGETKIVDATKPDPRANACTFRIFYAAEYPDVVLGYIDRHQNSKALVDLEKGLQQAADALKSLSVPVMISFDEAASQRLRESYDPPSAGPGSALVTLQLLEQAVQVGVEAARKKLKEIGDDPTKAKRRAAAVAGACREVYSTRLRVPAPRSALDRPEKAGDDPKPALFVQFAENVFEVLEIVSTVAGALSRWRQLDEEAQK